jgi:hypothetical protein
MSWFQRKRKARASKRSCHLLSFEVLEDRWVPSTLAMPTLLASDPGGGLFQQTRMAVDNPAAVVPAASGATLQPTGEVEDSTTRTQVSPPQLSATPAPSGTTLLPTGEVEGCTTRTQVSPPELSGTPTPSGTTLLPTGEVEDSGTKTQVSPPELSGTPAPSGTPLLPTGEVEDSTLGSQGSQPENKASTSPLTPTGTTQQSTGEVEDSTTRTQVSQPAHAGTTPQATGEDQVSTAAGNVSQPVKENPSLQQTTITINTITIEVIISLRDLQATAISESPSEAPEPSGSGNAKVSLQNNGGSGVAPTRTPFVSDSTGDNIPRGTTSAVPPDGNPTLINRQIDVNQRLADGFLPGSGQPGPGIGNLPVLSGKPISPGLSAGMHRIEGFVPEMPLGAEGLSDPGHTRVEGISLPQTSELIEDVSPLDLAGLEAAWQNLLANLENGVQDLMLWSAQTGLVPFLLAIGLSGAAVELIRRRVAQADAQIRPFEAVDGKSSGLKHFPTGPQP